MIYNADEQSNPFGFDPDCDRFVPGFGDVNADFHVVGDNPGVHGGVTSGFPFTETEGAKRLQGALVRGGLLRKAGCPPTIGSTYLSYLDLCVSDGTPTSAADTVGETFAVAEIRAITAHILLPVGKRATRWVFEHMTARASDDLDMRSLHATESIGSGWLVVPIAEPESWADDEKRELGAALTELRDRDYRRQADLGRLAGGSGSYYVR